MADNNSGEGILAFILGSLFGAAIGLLLAPAKGDETRKRILDWLEENRKKTRHFIDEEREVLEVKKSQFSEAWKAGKKAYEETENGS